MPRCGETAACRSAIRRSVGGSPQIARPIKDMEPHRAIQWVDAALGRNFAHLRCNPGLKNKKVKRLAASLGDTRQHPETWRVMRIGRRVRMGWISRFAPAKWLSSTCAPMPGKTKALRAFTILFTNRRLPIGRLDHREIPDYDATQEYQERAPHTAVRGKMGVRVNLVYPRHTRRVDAGFSLFGQ